MRILVVEDEHRIASAIKRGLEQENFAVDLAHDGEHGLDMAVSEEYDLIVLDLMLPKLDGIELCQRLRQEEIHTPILMLTAKSSLQDKVTGLDQGADDYLTKPFAFEELLARIRALLRRPPQHLQEPLTYKNLTLDTSKLTASYQNKPLNLSKKEFAILEYLLRHLGKVVTKQELIAHVWNYDADVLENTVEVNIRNLRKKLGQPDPIRTVRGFGYQLGGSK